MAEKITKRVSRIISGSFNALLGAIEQASPETIMEQALKEVDETIDEVSSELGKCLAIKHNASKKLLEKNTKHEALSEQIELSLEENREDLAKAAIAEQFDIEIQIPVLENSIAESNERAKELEFFISALQAKKREMQQELLQLKNTVSLPTSTKFNQNIEKKLINSSAVFDRMLAKKQGFNLLDETDFDNSKKLAELEKLVQEKRIEERLNLIKNKLTLEG